MKESITVCLRTVGLLALVIASSAFAQGKVAGELSAVKVATAPVVDGAVDDVWHSVPALLVPLGETYDVYDPASIKDCVGCHRFDSHVAVSLKAVYTNDRIYMLATWPDPTASLTRGGSWSFTDGTWQKLTPEQSEDRIALYWPIGQTTGDPWNTGGCMSKCHMYYPTNEDPHESVNGIVDDAWLAAGRADSWHSKAARGSAVTSATGSGLVVDPGTHEVTAGTFSMTGYIDDKYVAQWSAENGEDGGRYGDAGSSADSHNRIGDKSRPKYMEKVPAGYADAMALTQAEIDAAECIGNPDTGVSDADAALYWPAYAAVNAVVPERILRVPGGSRADIAFGATWQGGFWAAEIARDLNTGHDDDVQFDISQAYSFEVATFENSRHGYEHRISQPYSLSFGGAAPTSVSEVSGEVPTSYELAQNYPNPFNPLTTIAYDLPRASEVTLTVYTISGQKVSTLVSGYQPAGQYRVDWEGRVSASGVYLYRLEAEGFTKTQRMVLMK